MTRPSFKLKLDSTSSIHIDYFYSAIDRLNKRAKYNAVEITDYDECKKWVYQDGYPIPEEPDVVLYTLSPFSSGYGGLTFVGGRGGGCAIYIYNDINSRMSRNSKKSFMNEDMRKLKRYLSAIKF